MARELHRLSDKEVRSSKLAAGKYADGGGLYLIVDKSSARRWAFIFRWDGKLKEMGLGGLLKVDLPMARGFADEARKTLGAGRNPIDQRREQRPIPTFGEFADALVETLKSEWRNEKHKAQWTMTLKVHAAKLRGRRVDQITTEHVLEVLKPLWTTRPETASRLRGRIERVLDAATANGLRSGPNPATWRGHLAHLLGKREKLTRGHHAALPYSRMPAFTAALREREGTAALALEFAILTAARTGEVRGATWAEVDLEGRLWTLGPARMKAKREHRVPLTDRAVEIATAMKDLRRDDYLFPGHAKGKPLSNGAMERVLDRMGEKVTVHGFRSSFRDWVTEETNFADQLAEAALAHVVGDKTERAYRRGDALEKRRALMDAWANFCAGKGMAQLVPFQAATK